MTKAVSSSLGAAFLFFRYTMSLERFGRFLGAFLALVGAFLTVSAIAFTLGRQAAALLP
jgi:hypothetical protein